MVALKNEELKIDGTLQGYEYLDLEWKVILPEYCCIFALVRDAKNKIKQQLLNHNKKSVCILNLSNSSVYTVAKSRSNG